MSQEYYIVNCLTCLGQGKYMLPSGRYYRCQGCAGTGREHISSIRLATARAKALYICRQENPTVILPPNVSENWRRWTEFDGPFCERCGAPCELSISDQLCPNCAFDEDIVIGSAYNPETQHYHCLDCGKMLTSKLETGRAYCTSCAINHDHLEPGMGRL